MIAQDKFMSVYTTKQTHRPLSNIIGEPSPKIRIAKNSLTKQAYKIVYEENNKKLIDDSPTGYDYTAEDNAEYWNNLDIVELHNIRNMMEE